MQKTFIRYTFAIMTAAVFLIFIINCLFTMHNLNTQQYNTFYAKSKQVIHTLENNKMELSMLKKNLDEDYLTRARAAAYVLDRQKEVSMDVEQMQYLAELLNVDELHLIDENGIIISASVSDYVGFDMDSHMQTREFLSILESEDEDAFLIQEAQPNDAEGRVMQYVGVARIGQKGVVQVGFKPTRQMEAQSRNTYEYIFSKFPTDVGEELFAVHHTTGEILGHSAGIEQDFSMEYCQLDKLLECRDGAYKRGEDGRWMYVFVQEYNDILICAALPFDSLLNKLLENVFSTLLYLLTIEAIVILLLNYLVKRKVVDGIHHIMQNLSDITNGNLDTKVTVGGNREFESLSNGINTMVKSIVSISNRLSAIIDISGIPLAAFEYELGVDHVFVTSGLRTLLDLQDQEAEALYRDSKQFGAYIEEITAKPMEGEVCIYQIDESKYVRIHMSQSQEKHLGVVIDASRDILEKKRILYENTHDPLTGLYKYPHFKQLATEKIQNMADRSVCAVVMMDLDFFKTVNDTYGHDVGDRYLQSFANVLQSMPEEHFLTARRAGDEFCMMLFGCEDASQVKELLQEFYEILEEQRVAFSAEHAGKIKVSSGFVLVKKTTDSIEELLNHADEALYYVKRNNRGNYGEYGT